jgi:hypothetical protein
MGVRAVRSDGAGKCNAEKSHCGQTKCEAHFQTGLEKWNCSKMKLRLLVVVCSNEAECLVVVTE